MVTRVQENDLLVYFKSVYIYTALHYQDLQLLKLLLKQNQRKRCREQYRVGSKMFK